MTESPWDPEEFMRDDVLNWLLDPVDPNVRYWALRDLMDRDLSARAYNIVYG